MAFFSSVRIVAMSVATENHPNNARLRELINSKRLSLAVALTIFNRGRSAPVTESILKSWLADPGESRWSALQDDDLQHAEVVFFEI